MAITPSRSPHVALVVLDPSPRVCTAFDVAPSSVCVLECDVPRLSLMPLAQWKAKQFSKGNDGCVWRKLLFTSRREPVGAHGAAAAVTEEILLRLGPRLYPTVVQNILRRGLPDRLTGMLVPPTSRVANCVEVCSARVSSRQRRIRFRGDVWTRRPGPGDRHPGLDPGRFLRLTVERSLLWTGDSIALFGPHNRRRG